MAQITIPDSLAERLEEMAREQGLTVAELLREIVGQKAPKPETTREERRAARKRQANEEIE